MIGPLAHRAPTYSDLDLLERALAELGSGWPVVVDRGERTYELLLPQAAVGHRGTRRLGDLPLIPAKPLSDDTPVADALAYLRAAGVDFALVARDRDVVGLVSYATLLADAVPEELVGGDAATLEHLLAGSVDGFAILDEAGAIRAANHAGHAMARILTGADEPVELSSLAQECAGGAGCDRAVQFEGSDYVIEVRVVRSSEGGQVRSVLLLRDVTEARRAEEDAARRSQMTGFGQLAGAIAHDFNNVLTVITAQASFLQQQLRDEVGGESAASILDATRVAADLVERLRSFARNEPLAPRPLEIDGVLRSLRRLVADFAGEGVEVVFDIASDVEPVVADPTQIERAVCNLVVNAGQAMSGGGTLTIRVDMVEADGRYLRLAVTDTGSGMDEETLSRCFDPYFTTRPGKGLGLGLATVYSIVGDMGGHVRVRSTLGEGTTFELLLPRVRSEGPLAGAVILVVDDDPHVAEAVAQILGAEGARPVTAPGSDMALDWVAANGAPDVVVADVRMPGGSGPALLERLRADHPQLHCLLMTGDPDPSIVNAAARLRVELIRKPFTPEGLVSAVGAALADEDIHDV